jgi:hypothetical protein
MGQAKRRGTYEERVAQAQAKPVEVLLSWKIRDDPMRVRRPRRPVPMAPGIAIACMAAMCGWRR